MDMLKLRILAKTVPGGIPATSGVAASASAEGTSRLEFLQGSAAAAGGAAVVLATPRRGRAVRGHVRGERGERGRCPRTPAGCDRPSRCPTRARARRFLRRSALRTSDRRPLAVTRGPAAARPRRADRACASRPSLCRGPRRRAAMRRQMRALRCSAAPPSSQPPARSPPALRSRSPTSVVCRRCPYKPKLRAWISRKPGENGLQLAADPRVRDARIAVGGSPRGGRPERLAGEHWNDRSRVHGAAADQRLSSCDPPHDRSSVLLYVGLGILYVVLLIVLGLKCIKGGRWVMFVLGFIFPVLWIIGGVLAAEGDVARRQHLRAARKVRVALRRSVASPAPSAVPAPSGGGRS